jgi:hypothetical protein
VADAAGDDPDERLARLGRLQLDVLDDERLPELLEDCGPDVQRCEVAPAGSSCMDSYDIYAPVSDGNDRGAKANRFCLTRRVIPCCLLSVASRRWLAALLGICAVVLFLTLIGKATAA